MEKLTVRLLFIITLIFLFEGETFSQQNYRLNQNKSSLLVKGTSNLHDWRMEVINIKSEASLKIEDGSVSELVHVEFNAPVEGLESEKRRMERKAEKALHKKKHPLIKFWFDNKMELNLSEGNRMQLTGQLTVSGSTNMIKIPVEFNIDSDRQFRVNGTFSLEMTDFGIKPPEALFGTIKADNEIKLEYDFVFVKSDEDLQNVP